MKKSYKLDGLDCANCAAKMERAISKIDGVENIGINFITLKMMVEIADESFDSVFEKVMVAIKKIEPDLKVQRC